MPTNLSSTNIDKHLLCARHCAPLKRRLQGERERLGAKLRTWEIQYMGQERKLSFKGIKLLKTGWQGPLGSDSAFAV